MNRKYLLAATALTLGACASPDRLPSVQHAAPPPMPVFHSLPGIGTFPMQQKPKATLRAGVHSPKKSQMTGTTWIVPHNADSDYVLPIGTTNYETFQPAQQTLVTFDCPVIMHSAPNSAFLVEQFGNAVTVSASEGAPPGIEMRLFVQACGKNHKLVARTVRGLGLSEARFQYPDDSASTPRGATSCTDSNYRVDKVITGGPTGACTVVDPRGAATATYFSLPANTQQVPAVFVGDGNERRPARVTNERLPTGESLYRVQGSWPQLVLDYPTGETVIVSRGR